MRAVVIYESMYGNTHLIAQAIGRGLTTPDVEVEVVPVEQADEAMGRGVDLLVVGGPTHGHGMAREATREAAVADAKKPDSELELDPDAPGPGLREWFEAAGTLRYRAAAFDTRFDMAAALTGRASKGIGKRLRRHGATLVVDPESFFVEKGNHLEAGEEDRARAWGAALVGAAFGAVTPLR